MSGDETLSPVEIRILAFLAAPRRRFMSLEEIVLGSGDAVFSVKAALAVLCRRAYATSSGTPLGNREWACTGLGDHALARLTVHQVCEAQLLDGDDADELALRRPGAHGGRRHG